MSKTGFKTFVENFTKKMLFLALFVFILTLFGSNINTQARGGCFVTGTIIDTPTGPKPIETLQRGDEVWSLDVATNTKVIAKIGGIQVLETGEYFVINDSIKVTATHPFFVQDKDKIKVVEMHSLKLNDQLIKIDGKTEKITSIKKIEEKVKVYNLLDVTPNHNYFANGFLVHNKGGGGGGGGGGSSSSGRSSRYGSSSNTSFLLYVDSVERQKCIDRQKWSTFFGAFSTLAMTFVGGGVVLFLWKKEKDFITKEFVGKTFTTKPELLEFIKTFCPNFQNIYHGNYLLDDQVWRVLPMEKQLDIVNYDDFKSKVEKIFTNYQIDWTTKNWSKMMSYTTDSYFDKQKQIFERSFGNAFDVVFAPKINSLGINNISTNYQNQTMVRVQLNMEMINFAIKDNQVYLGNSNLRLCTEFWTFCQSDTGWKLNNIEN